MISSRGIVQKIPKAIVAYPFQFALSFVFFLSAINLMLGFGDSRTLTAVGPDNLMLYYWIYSSLLGGLLTMIGMIWGARTTIVKSILRAHALEKLGLILQGFATLIYGIVVIYLTGVTAIVGSSLFMILAFAFFFKILTLTASDQSLKKLLKNAILKETEELE